MMKISYLVLGPFMTNTYIAWDEETKKRSSLIRPSVRSIYGRPF